MLRSSPCRWYSHSLIVRIWVLRSRRRSGPGPGRWRKSRRGRHSGRGSRCSRRRGCRHRSSGRRCSSSSCSCSGRCCCCYRRRRWTRLSTVSSAGVLGDAGLVAGQLRPSSWRWRRGNIPTPDDHFTAGPHCRVIKSAIGRADEARGSPTIGAGIVSPAGAQQDMGIQPAPDDHFAAGPDCSVNVPGHGREGGGGCPTVCVGVVSPTRVKYCRII